jgi:hypothetical protein
MKREGRKKTLISILLVILLSSLFVLPVFAETTTNTCRLINKSVNVSKAINSTASCLRINRSNIIVNCLGNVINYSRTNAGVGINITGFNNVTIHNCSIKEGAGTANGYGIFMQASRGNNISHNNITTSGTDAYGIIATGNSNYTSFTSNTVTTTGTTGHGVYINQTSIYNNATRNVINTSGTAAYGIFVEHQSDYTNLSLNEVNTSGSNAIAVYFHNASNNSVTSTDINTTGTRGHGIHLNRSASANLVENSTVLTRGSSGHGVVSNVTTLNVVRNTKLDTTQEGGIFLRETTQHNISRVNISVGLENKIGIQMLFANTTLVNASNITVNGNSTKGIHVKNISEFNVLSFNRIVVIGNDTSGITIRDANNNNVTGNNITVEGVGSIRGIDNEVSNSTHIIANNLSINGSASIGINILSSISVNASFNNLSHRGRDGEASGTGMSVIAADQANKSIISYNTINASIFHNDGSATGIDLNVAYLTKVLHNTINMSGSYGIALLSEQHSNLSYNTVRIGGFEAIALQVNMASDNNNISIIQNNLDSLSSVGVGLGIGIIQAVANTARENNITTYNDSASGIITLGAGYSNISNNLIRTYGNTSHGIQIGSNGAEAVEVNNTFTGNNITTTGENASGIYLDRNSGVGNNTFINNTVTSSNGLVIEDLSGANFFNHLVYNNSFGYINWSKENLTTNISLIVQGVGKTIFLENKHVGLANGSFPMQLNGSARISMYQTGITERPELLKNGVRCDDTATCNMSYNEDDKLLHANVSGFSSYVAALSPRPFVEKNTGGGGSSSSSTPTATATPSTPSTVSTTTSSIAVSKGTPSVISVKGKSYPVSVVTAASQRSATVQVGTQTISLAVGEKSEVDVDKDGKADMVVKVVAVSQSKAIMETTLIESSTSETTQAVSGNKGRRGFKPKTNEQSSGASVQGGHSVTQQTEKTTATPQAVLKDMLKTSSPGTIIAVIILGALAGLYTISGKNTPQELKKLARTTQQHTKKILRKIQKKL